jgi:prophage regulatory protein
MTSPTFNNSSTRRILRLPEVMHLTGLARSTVYLRIAEGDFPKQIRLGPRTVGWSSDAIEQWLEERLHDL